MQSVRQTTCIVIDCKLDREPLCKFLNKAVPDQPFPEGNSVTIFQGRAAKIFDEMNRRADRNMTIVGAVLMVGIAAILSFRYNAWQTIW